MNSMVMDREFVERFDARGVNITKLTKAVDLTIMVEECDYALLRIKRQLAEPDFGDDEWRNAALIAVEDYAHTRQMAQLKLDDIVAQKALFVGKSAEEKFASRFVTVAKEILPDAVYTALFQTTVDRAVQ